MPRSSIRQRVKLVFLMSAMPISVFAVNNSINSTSNALNVRFLGWSKLIKILAGDYYVADNVGVTSVTLEYVITEIH